MISIYTQLDSQCTSIIKYIISNEKNGKLLLKKYRLMECSPQESAIVQEWLLDALNRMPAMYTAEQEATLKETVWREIASKLSL